MFLTAKLLQNVVSEKSEALFFCFIPNDGVEMFLSKTISSQ